MGYGIKSCVRCRCALDYYSRNLRFCNECRCKRVREAQAAIAEVHAAIRKGHLPAAKDHRCVDCGKPARDYEHRDYTKPLDVVPVCRSCNVKRGAAYDSVYRPQQAA